MTEEELDANIDRIGEEGYHWNHGYGKHGRIGDK
jgi:hypothetical protein